MSFGNPSLGDLLAQNGGPHQLLAALAEWGILVAVRPDRSVVLGTTQSGERVLLGYTSRLTYARHRGSHALSGCDAEMILDIQRVTRVREIVIDAGGPAAAAIPIEDLQRYLRTAKRHPATPALSALGSGPPPTAYATGAMATVPPARKSPSPALDPLSPSRIPAPRPHLSGAMHVIDPGYQRTNHPILPALRVAIGELLHDYPAIHHVWISDARAVSGAAGLMLHVKVTAANAEEMVGELHHRARARLPQLAASGAPVLMARVADAYTEHRMIELGAHVVFPS